jgi:hypothetical protein
VILPARCVFITIVKNSACEFVFNHDERIAHRLPNPNRRSVSGDGVANRDPNRDRARRRVVTSNVSSGSVAQRNRKHTVPGLTTEVTLSRNLEREFGLSPVGLRPGGGVSKVAFENDAIAGFALFQQGEGFVDLAHRHFLNDWGNLMTGAKFQHFGNGGGTAER